jgi:hypothetical protein
MIPVMGPGGSVSAPASALDVGIDAVRALDVGHMAMTATISEGVVVVDLEVVAIGNHRHR